MYFRLKFEIQKKYSIEKFANLLNISDKTLRNKINGTTDFTWSEVLRIREILNPDLKLEELFQKE